MRLHPEEAEAPSWVAVDDVELGARVRQLLPAGDRGLILVDGRSGSGKSTFSARLARLLDATVVKTDDIAWRHDPIDWADVLLAGVIAPWKRGDTVAFRPPAWIAHDGPGAVEASPRPVLIVEGVGAGRAYLAERSELVVWVQSDRDQARRRGLARDVELGRTPEEAEDFWGIWMRHEEPFLAADRPWTRASLVVNGTDPGPKNARTLLAAGPLND
ncbi:MAG TPA: hypothetical protein VLM11_08535 [Streptosporangiaceae bacterium]|nr:hypothetical protein [Streptosporangiaceae bacterium]